MVKLVRLVGLVLLDTSVDKVQKDLQEKQVGPDQRDLLVLRVLKEKLALLARQAL